MPRALLVLVVDDDAGIRENLPDVLQDEGFDVMVVGSGPSALDAAHMLRPDICLVDVHMPGMDGVQLAKELHKESRPVVLMTAESRQDGEEAQAEAQAEWLVRKPFDLPKLFEVLRRFARAS
jgi:CheY-like chemotaxis protein